MPPAPTLKPPPKPSAARVLREREACEARRLADATIALIDAQLRLLTHGQGLVYADRIAHHLRPDPAAIARGVR